MQEVSYDFYLTAFGGSEMERGVYENLKTKALTVIESLVNIFDESDMTENQLNSVKLAISAETEYLAIHGGTSFVNGEGDILSEEIGNYRYIRENKNLPSLGGLPVSPLAAAILRNAGLLPSII